jgi:Protein of unknown function (DUF4231)
VGTNPGWMGDELPDPTDPDISESASWASFRDQFAVYSRGARVNRVAYQVARIVSLTAAAAVTVSAGLSAPAWVTASLGGLIVVIEGLQQLFQWHENWIAYRQAAETMRQHAIDFEAGVSPYDSRVMHDRLSRLALTRRDVALRESGGWAGRMRSAGASEGAGGL